MSDNKREPSSPSSSPAPQLDEAWAFPRDPGTIGELTLDCLGAISRCEIGTLGKAPESAMRTVAGVPASYASAGQHIAVKTISSLEKLSSEQRERWGLSRQDLKLATRVAFGVRKVWKEATREAGASTLAELRGAVDEKALRLSRLDRADLERMLEGGRLFRALRAAMDAAGGQKALRQDKQARNRCAETFVQASTLAKQLGLRKQDIRIYIRTGFGEDRAAWQRLALEKERADGDDAHLIGAKIKAAAEAQGGWALPYVDVENSVKRKLTDEPRASDIAVLHAAIEAHSQNPRAAYIKKATRNFRELRAERRAGKGWALADSASSDD